MRKRRQALYLPPDALWLIEYEDQWARYKALDHPAYLVQVVEALMFRALLYAGKGINRYEELFIATKTFERLGSATNGNRGNTRQGRDTKM